jgi:hypothetical protein
MGWPGAAGDRPGRQTVSDVAALGVTSLAADRAGPETIVGLVRGQWAIESPHWLRSPGVV